MLRSLHDALCDLSAPQVPAQLRLEAGQAQLTHIMGQFIEFLHDRIHEAPPSRLSANGRGVKLLYLPRLPRVQLTTRHCQPIQCVWIACQHDPLQEHKGVIPVQVVRRQPPQVPNDVTDMFMLPSTLGLQEEAIKSA